MTALTLNLQSLMLGGKPILRDIKTTLRPGELIALVGANGAGKTSLLRAVMGLLPFDGEVFLGETELRSLTPPMRARHLAYLPQNQPVFWPLAAEALVALGLPIRCDNPSAAIARAMQLAGAENLAGRRIDRISGGERTRLHLARALAGETPVLLADEPTVSLDLWHQLSLMQRLRDLAETNKMIIVAALHDLSLATRFCHRALLLHQTRLIADAPPHTALDPKTLEKIWNIELWPQTIEGELFLLGGKPSTRQS